MIALAIDCASSICSLALYKNGQIFTKERSGLRSHSQSILPLINELCSGAEIDLSLVTHCIYARGPGSFTGLRLATAVIQGLAFQHAFKLYAISNLQLIAQQLFKSSNQFLTQQQIIVCNDARLNEVYFSMFTFENELATFVSDEKCEAPNNVLSLANSQTQKPYLYGTGLLNYSEFNDYPNKLEYNEKPVAEYCFEYLLKQKATEIISSENVLPSYLKNPYQTKK